MLLNQTPSNLHKSSSADPLPPQAHEVSVHYTTFNGYYKCVHNLFSLVTKAAPAIMLSTLSVPNFWCRVQHSVSVLKDEKVRLNSFFCFLSCNLAIFLFPSTYVHQFPPGVGNSRTTFLLNNDSV